MERIAARLEGKEVPAAPQRADTERRRTYKTKAETEQKKPVTSTIVLTLLAISFVVRWGAAACQGAGLGAYLTATGDSSPPIAAQVPMLQYFGYTNKD